jgi:hypothetical protein
MATSKPKPSTRHAAIYHASRRVQLDSEGYVADQPNPNAFHEDRGDRTPFCASTWSTEQWGRGFKPATFGL